jgi:peptide/nickel transport system ATP-binding protein
MAGVGKTHLRQQDPMLLQVEDLVVEFPAGRHNRVHAVSEVSFDIAHGETLGLVGESGCGKSSTGRAIMQLPPPTSGTVTFDGSKLTALSGEDLRRLRPRFQMIFQDPISSLTARRKVKDLVAEGLRIWGTPGGTTVWDQVEAALDAVGLDPDLVANRYPHTFSGGQCQRICIARALVMDPKLMICDEPVSALDVSVQAQILNLLEDMKARYGLTVLFISHDLGVVKNISDRVIVMYLGRVCEIAATDALFSKPAHPYTQLLLASAPRPEAKRVQSRPTVRGELPSPIDPPSGCRFSTRCPLAEVRCHQEVPQIRELTAGHFVACHFAEQATGLTQTPPFPFTTPG